MNCCKQKPIFELNNNKKLCKKHFIKYFEDKVFKTIRKYDLLGKKENIGVAVSGGKDSLTVLNILKKLSDQNPKLKLTAIAIDEGIKNYRDQSLETANKFCKKQKIGLKIYSFKKEFGIPLDKMIKVLNVNPCTICGIFRRYLLNTKSKKLHLTKLATGHNLDDECQSIMMNQFKNNIHLSARLGPMTGIDSINNNKKSKTKSQKNNIFVQRIKPLYLCTEKEVATYAFLTGLMDEFNECPYAKQSYRAEIRDMMNDLENKFPGTKNSIVNSFLSILPSLKAKFTSSALNICKTCNEPAAKDKCNACRYVDKLKKIKRK